MKDRLTSAALKATRPTQKPYKLADGGGLFLLIKPQGKRLWRFRYFFERVEKMLSFGEYPYTSLQLARQKRDDAKKLLAAGVDPSADRKAKRVESVERFEAISDEYWVEHSPTLSTSTRRAEGKRRDYLVAAFNGKALNAITPVDVANAVRDIKAEHGHDTARRCHGLADRIWERAVALGRAPSNPAAGFKPRVVIGKNKTINRPGITDPTRFAALLRAIDSYTGSAVTRAALQLQARVFVRPGKELVKARWSEFDLDRAMWTIPAARMKQRYVRDTDHLVPLSTQSVALLSELAKLTERGPDSYVFAGLSPGRPISENTLNSALRRMDFDTKTVHCAHGFRSSASTILRERLRLDPAWIEMQLAHAKKGIAAAYDKSAYLEDRVAMMQRWSDYLDELLRR
jgi:integrase